MAYKSNIVKKPWGYEYLAYENEHVGLWFLHILHEQRTSMHCHPNKTTGLMNIDGEAEVSFLNDKFNLKPRHKLMIRKGLFHSTKAIHERGAFVFEIETPKDKHDLVRFKDSYGREGKPYEDSTFETPKPSECLWITDPPRGSENTYKFQNSIIRVKNITQAEQFNAIDDDTNIVFLKGGLMTDYAVNVAGPGDIVLCSVIKKLMNVFKKMDKETIIMTVEAPNE
jgi:mannose-6-phosphate isomerase-like protein (cupin superfamily)